jgi:RNA polymerase sigma factor (sigma-70 family)
MKNTDAADFYGEILTFVYKRIHLMNTARDITQDAFVSLCKNGSHIEKASEIRSFLYTVAKENIADWLRKQNNSAAIELEDSDGATTDYTYTEPDSKFIIDAIKTLNPDEQIIITSVYFVKRDQETTSKELGICKQTFYNILHRAQEKLAKIL